MIMVMVMIRIMMMMMMIVRMKMTTMMMILRIGLYCVGRGSSIWSHLATGYLPRFVIFVIFIFFIIIIIVKNWHGRTNRRLYKRCSRI